MMKKAKAVKPYIRPIFLWSTVKAQLFQPVVALGRRKMPRVWRGAATPAGGSSSVLGGCSMMAISVPLGHYLRVDRYAMI